MKCTFHRNTEVNLYQWSDIIRQMEEDLHKLLNHELTEEDVREYLFGLLPQAEPLEYHPEMRFFGFDDSNHMPADARVDFFFRPTYVASAFMMNALLQYPVVFTEFKDAEGTTGSDILKACLLGCTARGFLGAGFERLSGLLETLTLFVDARVLEFLAKYPNLCPEFTALVESSLKNLQKDYMKGAIKGPYSEDFTEDVRVLLEKAEMECTKGTDAAKAEQPSAKYVWYACYGSNLLRSRFMKYINDCTDTTPPEEDRPYLLPHNIYFAKEAVTWNNGGKAFLDVTKSGLALGRIYKVTESQYEEIKRMEGRDYRKKVTFQPIDGILVVSFTDTENNAERRIPSTDYFQTILDGLQECYGSQADAATLARYLIRAILPEEAWSAAKCIKKAPHYMTLKDIARNTGLNLGKTRKAIRWLLDHELIQQDRRSILAGHTITSAEAYFYTKKGEKGRGMIEKMMETEG